jgi:23S rRNA (uracil1939-C5)-methyltransferase
MSDAAAGSPTAGIRIEGVRIDGMSHGPDAVARHGGRVLFVAGAAPGDVADLLVTERRPRFDRARIERLRAPSPLRRTPACPWVGRCGGCQWQHLAYAAQLEAKHRSLCDHLRRIGGLPTDGVRPPIPAPTEWRYRHRIILRTERGRLGFYRAESHDLVEIDECRIAADPLAAALAPARRWLAAVRTTIRRLALVVGENAPGVVLVANAEGDFVPADDGANRDLVAAAKTGWARGVVMFGRGWWRSWGDVAVECEVEGVGLRTTGGEFTQVNLAANRLLVATVLDLAGFRPGEQVLDLYCGAGNLSLAFARRGARVLGVERARRAVADAEANATRLGLEACRFRCGAVARVLDRLVRDGARPDILVLDPPRGGAADALDGIAALGPRRVVYVSCDPPTLARDLAGLTRTGYRLTVLQSIDLFPQTYHLEAVAALDAS